MPTELKSRKVQELSEWMGRCTIAISADYTGLHVGQMNDLRRALRERDVHFRVVKNSLALLAADAAGRPELKEFIEGPTGIAFGYEDATEPARALTEFIRGSRSALRIKAGVMGERALSAAEVNTLASLPSREVLLGQLLGGMQSPITTLVQVLNGPVAGLVRVLQRHVEAAEPVDAAAASEK